MSLRRTFKIRVQTSDLNQSLSRSKSVSWRPTKKAYFNRVDYPLHPRLLKPRLRAFFPKGDAQFTLRCCHQSQSPSLKEALRESFRSINMNLIYPRRHCPQQGSMTQTTHSMTRSDPDIQGPSTTKTKKIKIRLHRPTLTKSQLRTSRP